MDAIHRGFEIALDEGYQPISESNWGTIARSRDGSADLPTWTRRVATNGDRTALLLWNALGTYIIEFRNERGRAAITLMDILPEVASRAEGMAGPDFALHAAQAFLAMSPDGLRGLAPTAEAIAINTLGRQSISMAMSVMRACSVAWSNQDVVEATQTLSWPDGTPTLSSMGTTRDGRTLEAKPHSRLQSIIDTIPPILTLKIRNAIDGVDSPECATYMLRDDFENSVRLESPEDLIRSIRASTDACRDLGLSSSEPPFDIAEISDEQ